MTKGKTSRIKLIMPPRSFLYEGYGLISIPPLGIAYLSSFLKKKGYDVELDDLDIKIISDKNLFDNLLDLQKKYNSKDLEDFLLGNTSNPYLEEVTELLLQNVDYKGWDIIGFSLIESSAVDFALLLSKKIKETTKAKIIFGGSCADLFIKEKYNFVDYVILGPGEKFLLDALYQIENKPQNNMPICLFPKLIPDFTGLPLSCYRNMPERGQFSNVGKILILPYTWAWGCQYKCSFCGNSLNEGHVSLKPVNEVVNELKELSQKKETKYFFILNEYVHSDSKHSSKLCREIKKQDLDIKWCGSARCNIDTNLVSLLQEAGCCYLFFGLESASDNILKKMRKGYNKEIAERTIRTVSRAGIWVNASIIVGFPNETEEDFNETFNFVDRNHEFLDQISVSKFYLVDSAITNEPKDFGIEIIENSGVDKNSSRETFSYNEINGFSWEELKKVKERRFHKLLKLFYLHKSIPEKIFRSSTYNLLYAFDKLEDKKKVLEFTKEQWHKTKLREEPVINISSLCNNNCLFCKKPSDATNSFEVISEKIKELKKNGAVRIVISGGEPTIEPLLFEILELVKKEDMEIKLKTNARMLSNPFFCRRVYSAGVRTISVPIFSNKPAVHDKVTKVNGSLNQSLRGIDNWKKIGGEVEIRTVLFDENKKNLSEFIDFILDLETDPVF